MHHFIPSKNHDRLNGREFAPDVVTGSCMVNPHYRSVTVVPGTRVRADSGAFQERDMKRRLHPGAALRRQLAFEKSRDKSGRLRFPSGFEYIVTYDMLVGVDEAIVDGKRVKRRGTEQTAVASVRATVASAKMYHRCRNLISGGIAYALQGVTPRQYLDCARRILPLVRPGRDIVAMGGFCIIGLVPSLKPLFAEVCRELAPMLAARGIHEVHVLGVCVTDALVIAFREFGHFGIRVATDSSSIEVNSTMGKVWDEKNMTRRRGASPWVKRWKPEDKRNGYHPADLAMENIRRFSEWVEGQGEGPLTPSRAIEPYQPSLW